MEDLRSTTVTDDPVQRRDLILLERAREGDLTAEAAAGYIFDVERAIRQRLRGRQPTPEAQAFAILSSYPGSYARGVDPDGDPRVIPTVPDDAEGAADGRPPGSCRSVPTRR